MNKKHGIWTNIRVPHMIKIQNFTKIIQKWCVYKLKCYFYGKIIEKKSPIFLTTFEVVKINQNLFFNVKNEVSPKLIKSGSFTK